MDIARGQQELLPALKTVLSIDASIRGLAAGGGVVMTYLFGEQHAAIAALAVLMTLDLLTGVANAWVRREVSSEFSRRAAVKKMQSLAVVIVGHLVDVVTTGGTPFITTAVIFVLIAGESMSVLENAAEAGVPIPRQLRHVLEKLRDDSEGRS